MLLEIFESEETSYSGGKKQSCFRYIVLLDKFNVTRYAVKCGVLPEIPFDIVTHVYYKKKIPRIYFTQNDYLDSIKDLLSYYFMHEGDFERPNTNYQSSVFHSVALSLDIPTLIEKQAMVNAKIQSLEQDFN